MEYTIVESDDFVERVKVLGIHKQDNHKLCHFFIVMVTWSDQSQITVYRKWRHIKIFQRDIIQSLKNSPGNAESMRYLKKTAQRLRETARSSRGTMGKLKMIDSLNDFLSAATHSKELAQSKIVQEFFKTNETDMTAAFWSVTGRTYLYVPRDTLGEHSSKVTPTTNDTAADAMKNPCIDSTGEDNQRDSEDEFDYSDSARRESIPATFIAIADFEGMLKEAEQNVFSLRQDEEVEVVERNESGWWLVRKQSEDHGCQNVDQHCGYVPASYLRESSTEDQDETFNSLEYTCQTPVFGPKIVTSNEIITDALELNDETKSYAGVFKKSPLDRLRNEFVYDSSDSELSVCSSEQSNCSDEIKEMTDKMGDLKMLRCRSATSSPCMLKRFANPPGLSSKQHSQRRNTLALPLDFENVSRRSSTGTISFQLEGEEYICKKSFVATADEEVSFNEGSVVRVLRRNSNGWWLASYNGKTGLVPGVHLQKYKDPIRRMSIHMLQSI